MITLSSFQSYLTSASSANERSASNMTGSGDVEEAQLLKWTANLPIKAESEQIKQLETILTRLNISEIDDKKRLRLMNIVVGAADRLIANLRKRYIYESGSLSDDQMYDMDQVKSLYYLIIMVYDGVIQRESAALDYQQHVPSTRVWQRFRRSEPVLPMTLAAAFYHSVLAYQKLLFESAICYQCPPTYVWSALNRLYRSASLHQLTHIDLTSEVMNRQATCIHDLYSQACLHSLLNVVAMRRSNILLAQRLLPEWSAHIRATLEPQTRTRLFVDLESDDPPEYLTSTTRINPYKADTYCLFIELEPLINHLRQRQEVLMTNHEEASEYRLVTEVLMALTHRYISRQAAALSSTKIKQRATVITGFSNIHYRVANNRSLMDLIAPESLPVEYLPTYDTAPQQKTKQTILEIELPENPDTASSLKTLRLLTAQDIADQSGITHISDYVDNQSSHAVRHVSVNPPKLTDIFEAVTTTQAEVSSERYKTNLLATAPPRLKSMSLFLLSPHPEDIKENWALGVVRWLNIDEQLVEAEAQILGHAPTACALRLVDRDNRSQAFVPALLLAREDTLQTTCSLLVPSYQFRANDRVMVRLNDKQKPLRLQRRLLATERFTQYEVVQL